MGETAEETGQFLDTFGRLPGVSWYPGHMVKAQRLVQSHYRSVDVVLEVRDARVRASERRRRG